MWVSWPQACIVPGVAEANSSPVSSVRGSPSMSARRRIVGPRRAPSITAVTAVVDVPSRGSSPSVRSSSTTIACVAGR